MGDEKKPKQSASKSKWNEHRKKYVPKPVPNSQIGQVKTYYLSEEELAYYRNLKRPIPDKMVRTTAPKSQREMRNRGQT